MVMRFRSGGEPSGRFHLGGLGGLGGVTPNPPVPPRVIAVAVAVAVPPIEEADQEPERTTWFTSSLELREGCEVCELTDESIDRIVL